MKIKELSLTNFRRFEQLDLKLPDSNFIILIGENGCGKSSVLDAMATAMESIIIGFTDLSNYFGESNIQEDDITNSKDSLKIYMIIDWKERLDVNFSYRNHKSIKLNPRFLFEEIQDKVQADSIANLPLLTYYGLNRAYHTNNPDSDDLRLLNKILSGYKFSFNENNSSFQEFEDWFISQENIENEQKINAKNLDYELISLKIIRKVIKLFLNEIDTPEFTNLRVVRWTTRLNLMFSNSTNQGELTIQKNNKEVKIKQLSSGEKMILLLVCDIARRLLILNSMDENCLEGEGVVLIDEIEMHLHPKWQRRIVPALRKVFPNIQFIATTHSPQVLSNLSDNEIIVLDGDKYYSPATNPYGRDSNGILEEIFGTAERPPKADKLVDEIFDILSNGQHDMEKAEIKLGELRGHLGAQDPILLRIENLINRKKILSR